MSQRARDKEKTRKKKERSMFPAKILQVTLVPSAFWRQLYTDIQEAPNSMKRSLCKEWSV